MLKISRLALATMLVCGIVAHAAELRLTSKSHNGCRIAKDSIAISVSGLTHSIGSFRLALALDEASYGLLNVTPGSFMTSCQWEYLNWRIDRTTPLPQSQYSMGALEFQASAILEITGLASVTPGHSPICLGGAGDLELVNVHFVVAQTAHGYSTQCQYLPIRFYWRDCRDNVLTSAQGDTALAVDYVNEPGIPGTSNPSGYTFPGFGAPLTACDSTASHPYATALDATNGGFDILCLDSLCFRGDLNLNGIPNEIADVVAYENYFTTGILPIYPPRTLAASVAQSDVNGDGVTLTVADLVCLIRIVVGDIQ